ncbi:acyltransferase [Pelagibacteraceae bacterium]|nr:acyltransferase [Pelagibacteraceae bacterium]
MIFFTLYYKILFKLINVRYGKNLKIYGPIFLENKKNINLELGDDVEIYPHLHIKSYRNCKIIVGNGVKLDSFVRLVVANSSTINIKHKSRIGKLSTINAGANIEIGNKNLISQNCMINSSAHNHQEVEPFVDQGYKHAPVILDDDVWVGANTIIEPGSVVGRHTVVGANCFIKGNVPENSIVKNTISQNISKK